MSFCLPKFAAENFKKKLKSGDIDPAKLMEMTSAERRAFFENIVGEENAAQVNASFESKIILKDQQRGMINWAKSITGIKPEVRTDILAKVERLDKVLEPEELDMFLEDLAEKRLGVGVSVEEAGRIVDLAKAIETAKEKMLPDHTFPTVGDKMTYGLAQVDFLDYIADLKQAAASRTFKEVLSDIKDKPGTSVAEFGGLVKSIKASLDDSALFNQGVPMLFAHPTKWGPNALQSVRDIVQTFGGKDVMRVLRADLVSDPEALDGTWKKMKLGIGITEESFPTQIHEKVPYVGRAFKAADTAFTAFQYRNRRDAARIVLRIAKEMGVDITDKARLAPIGEMINSLTGRGNLGKLEPAASSFNNVLFSPRFFKSHLDRLFLHPIGGAGGDPFVRKQAAKNLLKMVIGLAIILGTLKALAPDRVELDFRSTRSGKVKIFGHWVDITGGMGSLLTLAARIGTWSSKSASTGQVSPINSGKFGATTGWDLLTDFFGNKLSPLAGIARDILKGQDPNGNKPTFLNEAANLTVPIPITTFNELNQDPDKANVVASMILNTVGLNVSAYAPTPGSVVAEDKPAVVAEMFEKLAAGDDQGAKDLAHSFNEKLKETIADDYAKRNPDASPEDAEKAVDKKWKATAIYMPTAEEVAKYQAGDESVVKSISANGKPVVITAEPVGTAGIIGTVLTYAKAVGVDPATAFSDIFKGESIRYVTNGTVVVNRMSLTDSQQVKSDRGGNNPTMKLDHTLPLQLGGDNGADNLKLVPTATWASYTPVEDYLGSGLRAGRIDKKDAQQAIIDFKNGVITFDEIKTKYPAK